MNIFDILIIIIVTIVFLLAVKKIYSNYQCAKAKNICSGCALSGNCFKEDMRFKVK